MAALMAFPVATLLVFVLLLRAYPKLFFSWTAEDGPVENMTAAALFTSALLAIPACSRALMGNRKWLASYYGFLAVLFLIAAGEEISWGQRALDIETPEWLREANAQQEINLHNLKPVHDYLGRIKFVALLLIIAASISAWLWLERRWPRWNLVVPHPVLVPTWLSFVVYGLMRRAYADGYFASLPPGGVSRLQEPVELVLGCGLVAYLAMVLPLLSRLAANHRQEPSVDQK